MDTPAPNFPVINITGSWEGWVPTPQDLYYNGVNSAGFKSVSGIEFQAERIYFNNTQRSLMLVSSKSVSIKGMTKVVFDLQTLSLGITERNGIDIYVADKVIGSVSNVALGGISSYTIPINQAIANSGIIKINFYGGRTSSGIEFELSGAITRIRLV